MAHNALKETLFKSILALTCITLYLPIMAKKAHPPMPATHYCNAEPATEDLMREHGVLRRSLLIYEEIIRRIESRRQFPLDTLNKTAGIIQSFIEEFHEKQEEDYIFPLFEKHKKEVKLVRTLRNQHVQGKKITAQIQRITTGKKKLSDAQAAEIKKLLQDFITLYRPHAAHEDTVLFPQVRSLMSAQEFQEMGEHFEELEEKMFGKNGFTKILNQLTAIEKKLGIANLDQFTPHN